MALEKGQIAISLNTLYKARTKVGISHGNAQIQPNLFVNSGAVSVYGSNSATQPTALSEMTLNPENVQVQDIEAFGVVPLWIAVVQYTGTTTELVLNAVDVQDKGSIS